MNALVSLRGDTPITTSLAVAEGTKYDHASVIKLVRRYAGDLAEFGLLGFEIRAREAGQHGGGDAEYALLSEPQATLLITYMRNSEVVRAFKKRLVAAFFEMAQQLRQPSPREVAISPQHQADVLVSADRTFRALMRAARAAGLKSGAAIRRAQAATLSRTGIDVLAVLDLPMPTDAPDTAPPPARWEPALDSWCAENAGPVALVDVCAALGLEAESLELLQVARALRARGWNSRKLREKDSRGAVRQGMRWRRGSEGGGEARVS